MLRTLEEVIQRLVASYDPDRIILFGSYAAGRADQGSDIDLLVVKETELRQIDRQIEVERLLSDRSIPLDIRVYTPREVLGFYAAGNPLIEEVVEKGRVLYMRKETAAWLADAQEERDTASILLDHQKYRGACLHSQQCVEKGLKALILERGSRPPRTHDIVELLNQATAAGWNVDLAMDEAIFLNSVYRGRYPTEEGLLPRGDPTREEAGRAFAAAETVMAALRKLLPQSG
jgi:HEPN domain-containing protein/predicted nucleotidyltransferase